MTTKTKSEAGTPKLESHQLNLKGLTPIMFDRYAGDNDTILSPAQKLYLGGQNGKMICLPSANIMSFLSSQNTDSAPKRLLDSRKYKRFALACSSYVSIEPHGYIPFLRDGKEIEFGQFVEDKDDLSGCVIHRAVARLEKGIPNPKARPLLALPWELNFSVTIWPNKELQWQQLLNIFVDGMIAVGLGTFRGQYGKAAVALVD